MAKSAQGISESERDVLKVLWEHGASTVRELQAHLAESGRDWAHTTISTLLSRLEQKSCVVCDKSGFAHVFSAAVTRDEFMRSRLNCLADAFCDGTRVPLMLALVDGQSFSEEEIDQFRELLDQLESQGVKKKPRKKGGKK